MDVPLEKIAKPRAKRAQRPKLVSVEALLCPTLITDGGPAFRARMVRESLERRAFTYFQQRASGEGDPAADWAQAERDLLRPIAVELRETPAGCFLRAELPGVRPGDLEIVVERRKVQLCAHFAGIAAPGQVIYSEIRERDLLRTVGLPFEIEPARTELDLRLGLLELMLHRPSGWRR